MTHLCLPILVCVTQGHNIAPLEEKAVSNIDERSAFRAPFSVVHLVVTKVSVVDLYIHDLEGFNVSKER